jgi:4-carboxymuconolactone decarboxylase
MQSRLTELNDQNMTTEQKRVVNAILTGPRGNLDGPFLAWVHSPALADRAQALGAFCRYDTQLPLRLSELAILVTAAQWQSQAEWQIHEPIARSAGLEAEIIDALQKGGQPAFNDPEAEIIYQIGTELYATKRVSTALYQRGKELLGEVALVELIGIYGYYAFVAMTLNVFEVRRETEQPLPFEEPDS